MSTTRDENSRASTYISSDKPLFNKPRNIERKYFTKDARTKRDQDLLSPEGSLTSRIPTRINNPPKPAITLKGAWDKASKEEEDAVAKANRSVKDAVREGSPSPAPRTRGLVGETQREKDERRMRRLRDGMAVAPGTSSTRNGVRAEQALEDDSTVGTNGSGSVGSLSGSWTGVEDATDEDLERKMKLHERDQKRAAAALGSQRGLFSKGNVGTRVIETAQTLARRSSGSSIESEPGMRMPNTWGRKSRPTSGWMNRILSPESSDEAWRHPPRSQSEGSVDWVGAAAGVPLASIEDDSLTQEPTPPHSRPSSAQPITKSNEISQMWDADLDFTARSLQISTSPQLNIRNTNLDEIRSREIESLSKRAVATSRLEEIRERNSEERSVSPEAARKNSKENLSGRRVSEDADSRVDSRESSRSEARRTVDEEAQSNFFSAGRVGERTNPLPDENSAIDNGPVVTPSGPTEDKQLEPEISKVATTEMLPKVASLIVPGEEGFHERTVLEEEGEAIHGTPITIFPGAAERRKDLHSGHKREDSWSTLRKLAKVASASPSPANARNAERPLVETAKHTEGPTVSIEKPSEAEVRRLAGSTGNSNSKRNSTASSPPKSDVDPEERIAAEASLFELPPADNKSERNSIRYPSPERYGDPEETPRPKPDPLSLPTPVVTGAYIDTPAPRGRIPRVYRPDSPPSDADDALYDEVSRLALKDFIRNNSSKSSTKGGIRGRPSREQLAPLSSHPTGRSSKPRSRPRSRPPLINTANPASIEEYFRRLREEAQIEDSSLDDFDELLEAEADEPDPNSTTIIHPPIDIEKDEKGQSLSEKERDRRQEILAYERMNKTVKSSLRNIRDAKRGIERIEDRVNSTPDPVSHTHNHVECAACASPTLVYHLSIPLPRLWYRDLTKWNGIRFTWVGFILAIVLAWIISESITCEYICHPKYAIRNEWHPSDPFWGWALPTLLDRSTGGMLKVMVRSSWRLLVWIWGSWTGVGFGDWGPTGGSRPRHQMSRVPHGAGSWSEGSMFEDESI